jgi:hypothetical protein
MVDGLHARYLEGVALWRERELPAAIEVLSSVVGDAGPTGDDGWSHSAARALGQIALESDDPRQSCLSRRLGRLPTRGCPRMILM